LRLLRLLWFLDGEYSKFVEEHIEVVVKVELVENDEDEETDSYFSLIFFKTYCLFQDLRKGLKCSSHPPPPVRDLVQVAKHYQSQQQRS
jgi:hypothetical protein